MSDFKPQVNLVTAFGRGETLGLALKNSGFAVRVLDFSNSFAAEYGRGQGPFPIALRAANSAQEKFLSQLQPLSRGLAFWLGDGPIELGGPLADFYREKRKDVRSLRQAQAEFGDDWLRRFLLQWASPFHAEAWTALEGCSPFPWEGPLGQVPARGEAELLSFAGFSDVVPCSRFVDLSSDGPRLMEIVVECGQAMAFHADQWIWCLSSRETEILNSELATRLFHRGIWRPDWSWISFNAVCEHGPWSDGIPEFMVVVGDVYLPWVYANAINVQRSGNDLFKVWLKVPSKSLGEVEPRQGWAREVQELLQRRLGLARWTVNAEPWAICPHSPVFDPRLRDVGEPKWKNFAWIAPETTGRLDFSARLDAEALNLRRLEQWRTEQLKKQGAQGDSALHAP